MVSISMSAPNTIVRAALRALDSDIRTTQNRIATGLKVSSYSDDPTVWNAASGIRKDVTLADSVKSDIAMAKGRADVGATALKSILDRLGDIKEKHTLANATGATTAAKEAAAAEMTSLATQIDALVASATFQGVNLLTTAVSQTINIAMDSGAAISMAFAPSDLSDAAAKLKILTATAFTSTNAGDTTATTGTLAKITNAITEVTAYAGKVSGLSKALGTQMDFLTTLNDIRNKAVSSLVDADLEEESARAKALEVRQQLAYQALSIGNNAAQNILLLFR